MLLILVGLARVLLPKKSASVLPTASSGLARPKEAAVAWFIRIKRLCRSLK